jgi:hypothetical protein
MYVATVDWNYKFSAANWDYFSSYRSSFPQHDVSKEEHCALLNLIIVSQFFLRLLLSNKNTIVLINITVLHYISKAIVENEVSS